MSPSESSPERILIIRFSSFGDVVQTLSVAGALHERFPRAQIHWVTRKEFVSLIETHPAVAKIWSLDRKDGLMGLWVLTSLLKRVRFTHVYDAHNNLRSRLIGWRLSGFLMWRCLFGSLKFIRRPIYRWRRFLLFKFRQNFFPQPFNGQADLLRPLSRWGVPLLAPMAPQLFLKPDLRDQVLKRLRLAGRSFVALAPSAAFELKRWPLSHWLELIRFSDELDFAVLGGEEDDFLSRLESSFPTRVKNFAGKLSLSESAAVISAARALVSNDTGLLHVAEQMAIPAVALMGPAPFGFPSRPTTAILQLNLKCRPCSKHGQGPCTNPHFHQCLVDIYPKQVALTLRAQLRGSNV